MTTKLLRKNEVWLLADLLNSQYWDPNDQLGVEVMIGVEANAQLASPIGVDDNGLPTIGRHVASGLELEILDGIRLDRLDLKWEIDGVALLMKIRAITPEERFRIIDTVKLAWRHWRDNEKFTEVLDSLVAHPA